MLSVESHKFDAKRVVNCSSDQWLLFCLEGGNVSPLRLRRSSVAVKSLYDVSHSRPWFVIADSSECASAGLRGARVWVVSCGCRILFYLTTHNTTNIDAPGGLLYWGLWEMAERGSGVERLSLWELCEGNLEGGLLCWGPWRIGRKGSGDGHLCP